LNHETSFRTLLIFCAACGFAASNCMRLLFEPIIAIEISNPDGFVRSYEDKA
jgi:hypothetical protein